MSRINALRRASCGQKAVEICLEKKIPDKMVEKYHREATIQIWTCDNERYFGLEGRFGRQGNPTILEKCTNLDEVIFTRGLNLFALVSVLSG